MIKKSISYGFDLWERKFSVITTIIKVYFCWQFMVYFKRFEDIFYIIYRVGGNSGTLMDRKHKITEVKTSSCQPNLFAIIKINPKGFLGSRYQKQLCSQVFLHISVTPKKLKKTGYFFIKSGCVSRRFCFVCS